MKRTDASDFIDLGGHTAAPTKRLVSVRLDSDDVSCYDPTISRAQRGTKRSNRVRGDNK